MVSQPGSGELGESFQIRGLTGNHYVKILINGIPIKPSVVTGMPFGSQLPIRQAERIEVIYGTASAIYGADAVSGVINIITKEATKGTFVRGDIGLGQGGYNYINFMTGGKGGKNNNILQYSFYGSKTEHNAMDVGSKNADVYNPLNFYQQKGKIFHIGGEVYYPLQLSEKLLLSNGINLKEFKDQYYGKGYEGSLTHPDLEALSSSSHMIGLQMEFRGVHLSYNNMYRRTHSSIGLSPVFYKYNNPQNFWGENISQTNLGYSKDFRFFSTTTNFSSLVYRMDNNSNLGVTFMGTTDDVYRYSASNDILLEQIFTFRPLTGLEMVGGLSWQRSGNLPLTNYSLTPFNTKLYKPYSTSATFNDSLMGSFGYNPVAFNNTSGFGQLFYTLKKFRFLGGLRYDNNTLYGNRTSPQIALLYKRSKKTSMRLSVGTAYKAPPSSITFQSLAYPEGAGIHYKVAPNTDLQPEKFSTVEYGINTTIFKRLELNQTFYFYQITNHIVPKFVAVSGLTLPLAVNDSVTMWVNSGNSLSNVLGSQTNLRIPNIIRSIRMDAELSLSFLDRKDRLPNVTELVKEYLTLMPSHEGKLKVSFYPVKPLYISIESQWMSKWLRLFIPFESIYKQLFRDVDGFYSMNATSSFSLSPNLRAYFKVINLFDENYGGMNATILEENLIYNPQMRRSFRFGLTYNLN
jgi:outer membrane cobalamin receptor